MGRGGGTLEVESSRNLKARTTALLWNLINHSVDYSPRPQTPTPTSGSPEGAIKHLGGLLSSMFFRTEFYTNMQRIS